MSNMKEINRMCIVCRQMKDRRELNRIVLNKDNELFLDKTGKANGRGAYICKSGDCVTLIEKKNALNRTFKRNFDKSLIKNLCEEILNGEKQN